MAQPVKARSPTKSKSSAAVSQSPAARLLGCRPAVVASSVSKVEAISFEASVSTDRDQRRTSASSASALDWASFPQAFPSTSPSLSPPLPDLSSTPHHQPDTPTFRQLKTSLRSRLDSDCARQQRRGDETGKTSPLDSTSLSSPTQPQSATFAGPLETQIQSITESFIQPATSPSSDNAHSDHQSCDPNLATPQLSPDLTEEPASFSTRSPPLPAQATTTADAADLASNRVAGSSQVTTDPKKPKVSNSRSTRASPSAPPLPNLRVPLFGVSLSPPTLAKWSLRAYGCDESSELGDVAVHLSLLPLHTGLAVLRRVPVAGSYVCICTPLIEQSEVENQNVLVTASQIALGLVMAGGWKLAGQVLTPASKPAALMN